MKEELNKAIIIGADHYNTLGLCRTFGINGIKPFGIIINRSNKMGYCSLSRYWQQKYIISDYDETKIMDILLSNFGNETLPPVLFPSNDKIAYLIDVNKNSLKDKFIIPGFHNEKESVVYLINKDNQARWANSLGIKTAQTWLVDFSGDLDYQIEHIPYPCIVKPAGGNEGKKGDIRKCGNKEVFLRVLDDLKVNKNYKRVLVQEFIEKEYEMELFGCIPYHTDNIPFILTKHIREWPPIGGSVCCHEYTKDDNLVQKSEELLKKIRQSGFVGLFDIELFKVGNDVILNEINFRNSGDIYASLSEHFYYPYFWYLDAIGKDVSGLKMEYTEGHYAMNEVNDFNQVRAGFISLREWWAYRKKTTDFAFRFKKDLIPSIYHCFPYYLSCILKPRIHEDRK